MDKFITKKIWQSFNINTPPYMVLEKEQDCQDASELLGLPLVVKPALEGSSLGISKVSDLAELRQAYREASRYRGKVLAEKYIQGEEYTVAILQQVPLPVIKLETPRVFYDFTAKYESNDTRYLCPCGLSSGSERDLQDRALMAFEATTASGWGRVDVMLDEDYTPWFLEVNTVPGMTDHSLVPMAAKAQGIYFDQLVLRILETSMKKQG
jgi:D-alanine-D-alanine ligase